jgi:hypothetical protein
MEERLSPDAVRGRGHHRRWAAASRTERLTIRLTPLGIYIAPAAVPNQHPCRSSPWASAVFVRGAGGSEGVEQIGSAWSAEGPFSRGGP